MLVKTKTFAVVDVLRFLSVDVYKDFKNTVNISVIN